MTDGPPPTPAQQAAATAKFAWMRRQLTEQLPPLDLCPTATSMTLTDGYDSTLDRLTRQLPDYNEET